LEESIALFREVGDAWGLVAPLWYLGEIYHAQGDFAAARARLEEAVALAEPTGDKWRISATIDTLGEVVLSEGEYTRARALFEKSLAMCQEMGNNRRIAYELRNLGHTARFEQCYAEARSYYGKSLAWYLKEDDKRYIANTLDSLARLGMAEGQAMYAARLFGAVDVLRETVKAVMPGHERKDYGHNVAAAREALGEEAFAAAWAEGRTMTMEQTVEYALEEPTDA
jgi:tetratricopeptide (TPR) repeat protein